MIRWNTLRHYRSKLPPRRNTELPIGSLAKPLSVIELIITLSTNELPCREYYYYYCKLRTSEHEWIYRNHQTITGVFIHILIGSFSSCTTCRCIALINFVKRSTLSCTNIPYRQSDGVSQEIATCVLTAHPEQQFESMRAPYNSVLIRLSLLLGTIMMYLNNINLKLLI